MGLATNDIMSFVEKQSKHKRVNRELDSRVITSAMKSKVMDVCAHMKRLRQTRNKLRNRVSRKYLDSKSYGKRILQDMVTRYKSVRDDVLCEVDRKVRREMLAGVNEF